MNKLKDISTFFNRLRQSAGAIWMENEKIKFSAPKEFQDAETTDFIVKNKSQIIRVLKDNAILSDKKFLSVTIFRDNTQEYYPLSSAQERLWFIEQYEEGTHAYHIPAAYELAADTDKEGIKYALQQIVSRHEILRSTIEQSDKAGHGIQKVQNALLPVEEVIVAADDLDRLIKEDLNRPFELSKSYPLRVKFYTVQQDLPTSGNVLGRTILVINMHHIATDGWSMDLFQQELSAYYEAYTSGNTNFKLPALEIQYKDYALWQKSYLAGDSLDKQLKYWKDKLSGYQPLELPVDYARPEKTNYIGAYQKFTINKQTSSKLRELAQQHGVTLNSVLLSSFSILLSEYTGQDDIITGSDIANRHQRQTKELIGFFINSQVNRILLNDKQSFIELIRQVHEDQVEGQQHQDLPFEKLVDELKVERDASRHPVFQVMFGMQSFNHQGRNPDQEKNYLSPYSLSAEVELFDLSVYINDSAEKLEGLISFATSLFHKDTISRLAHHFTHLLDQLVKAPGRPYGEIGLPDASEYAQLSSWNLTEVSYPSEKTVVELFEAQAKKTPDAVALVHAGQQLSYQSLNEKSNQLAHYIRHQYKIRTSKELAADTLIAICMDRSLEIVVGILAVLKAGGAYVPVDPAYPQERIDYILEDTAVALVLVNSFDEAIAQLPEEKIISIGLNESFYTQEERSDLPRYSGPQGLAYIIYTSGSTGKPKGAMIEHAGMLNHLYAKINLLHLNEKSSVSQNASQSFDISVWQFLAALVVGGRVHIYAGDLILNPGQFIQQLESDCVTILEVVPSYLSAMLDVLEKDKSGHFKSIAYLLVTGEELKAELVKRWFGAFPGKLLVNAYGPTEASDDITHHVMEEYDGSKLIPVGKPVQNLKLYIVNSRMQLCPVGVRGEICVSGVGVGRGYLNNALKTGEAFMRDPFSEGDVRLYKTGDVGRWLPDGTIQYSGRKDEQVKIRGYRIELGEIEHALVQVEGIQQACVLAKERTTENATTKYLVAYYVGHKSLSPVILQNKLSWVLPEYMVPTALVAMDTFPLTANGKLDKRALPDPEMGSPTTEYVAPADELEIKLCEIWQAVLGLDKVSATDNFFRIGGDSILSIQVSGRIRQAGYSCQVKDIFECKTIARLAEQLRKKSTQVTLKTEQGILSGESGVLPVQQWFIEQKFAKPDHYNQSFLIKVPPLDVKKLETIIASLVNYHDVLRMRYVKEAGSWTQIYQPEITLPVLKTLDVSTHTAAELKAILTGWQSGFDIEKGILFQAGYLQGYEDGSARIYFAVHHLIVDGVSWRIIAEDLKSLYEGKTLPSKGSSYRQWAEAVKKYPEQHPSETTYWQEQLKGVPVYSSTIIASTSYKDFQLTKELTRSLLQDASKTYHTEVNDLLLTALAYALKEINHNNVQGITLEGHGREDIDPAIDHSHTVGWFTSMFPVKLEVKPTLKESIQFIKERLRSIPNKGIGFGAFAQDSLNGFSHTDLVPVSFNYLGQFDNHEGYWQLALEDSGDTIHADNANHHIIDINGLVNDGKLEFNIVTKLGSNVTTQLSECFKKQLIQVIEHCTEKLENKEGSHTPSDFKSVKISQSLLDKLQLKAKNI